MKIDLKELDGGGVWSQRNEDAILLALANQLGVTRYFVEFGAEDGAECCTRLLAQNNWRGMQIEAREDCWRDLADLNKPHRQRVHSVCERLDLDNLEEVFAGVPVGLGVCVIDVDGNDYYFAQEIAARWKPAIICVEVNHQIDPHTPWKQPYRPDRVWDGVSKDYGASEAAMTAMLEPLGYAFLGTEKAHVNAFYVRKELLDD